MKFKILVLGLLMLVFVSGCSSIDYDDQEEVCSFYGLERGGELSDKFECSSWINDEQARNILQELEIERFREIKCESNNKSTQRGQN